MLYPERASLVHVDFKVQFLCLGPFLSNLKVTLMKHGQYLVLDDTI